MPTKRNAIFGCASVEYLGYVISADGVATGSDKIKTMSEWPKPKNIKALRGFLGLTGYYRKFIRGYGAIAKPLITMLQKDQFKWGHEASIAFQSPKKAMTTVPIIVLADFADLFVVQSDASGPGLGVVLMQNQRPIAYFSQAWTDKS